MNPFISVITPVYNVQEYLPAFLDSIRAQTFRDFELILVDDGSTDNCGAICDAAALSDPRISVLHEENHGLAYARTAGFEISHGSYICHADSDDWVEPFWLETIHHDILCSNHPDILIYSYYENTCTQQRIVGQYLPAGLYNRQQTEEKIFPYMLNDTRQNEFGLSGISNNIWTKPMKRELYRKSKLTDFRISLAEDSCVSFPALYNADSVFLSNTPLYHYRIRPASITTGTSLHLKVNSLFLASEYLKKRIYDRPAMQISAWTMKQLTRLIYADCSHSSFHESLCHIRKAFSGKQKQLSTIQAKGFPLSSRLLLYSLRIRFYKAAVLMNRLLLRARR